MPDQTVFGSQALATAMRSAGALFLVLAAYPTAAYAQVPYCVPGPLVVEAAPYDLSCAGRDVLIRGDDLEVVLRGGCRSVTVQGRFDRVTAELLPGAGIAVGGAAVLLNYVLTGPGPAPVVRTTLPGLRATQIQRFGQNSLKLPTSRPEY